MVLDKALLPRSGCTVGQNIGMVQHQLTGTLLMCMSQVCSSSGLLADVEGCKTLRESTGQQHDR